MAGADHANVLCRWIRYVIPGELLVALPAGIVTFAKCGSSVWSNSRAEQLDTRVSQAPLSVRHERQHVTGSNSTHHPNNQLGGFTNMYTGEYEHVFQTTGGAEHLARGSWSSELKHPGDLYAGIRRYGAAKLCQVMML